MTLKEFLKSIADAIRAKKGTTATIKASDFATEIEGIETNEKKIAALAGGEAVDITEKDLDGLEFIRTYAFYHSNIVTLELPNTVKHIYGNAFYGSNKLVSVTLGENVETLEANSFYCKTLVEIYNKSSLTLTPGKETNSQIARYAKNVYTPTSGQSKLSKDVNGFILYTDETGICLVGYVGENVYTIIPNGVTEIFQYSFAESVLYQERKKISRVEVPKSVLKIGESAFSGCTELTEIDFSKHTSIPSLGSSAFYRCTAEIKVPSSLVANWKSATNWSNYSSQIVGV